VIIYSYLQPGLPLAPNINCLGFILSCRQAKDEIEELVRERLAGICTKIRNASGVEVTIRCDSASPRSVTVEVPHTAFNEFDASPQDAKWKREVLVGLHPLFAHPFDMVHIHISSDGLPESCISTHSKAPEEFQLQLKAQALLCAIGSMIDHVNRGVPLSVHASASRYCGYLLDRLEQRFTQTPGKDSSPYPTDAVKAKRICLSWDLRVSPKSDTVQLNGLLYHASRLTFPHIKPHYRPFDDTLHAVSRWREAQRLKKIKPLDPPNFNRAILYELADVDGLVGEIGIVSPLRWPLHVYGGPDVARMVEGYEVCNETMISSLGLGMEVTRGLRGVGMESLRVGRR